MKKITIKCPKGIGGKGEGEALVSKEAFSIRSDVDPETGDVTSNLTLPELYGKNIAGKVLVFPTGKGGVFSSWIMEDMAKRGLLPAAIINIEANPVFAYGAVFTGTPCVHRLEMNPLEVIETGDYVIVDADKGIVEVTKKEKK